MEMRNRRNSMSKEIRELLIWTTERVPMKMGKWSLMYREGEGKKERKNKNFLGLLNGHSARLCAVLRWMLEKGHLFFGDSKNPCLRISRTPLIVDWLFPKFS